MSASLGGLGDVYKRQVVAPVAHQTKKVGGASACVQQLGCCPCMAGQKAVSYTHLTLPTICSV
eukprot:10459112-Alexandrium_andersonii.AAC.1